MPLKDIAAPADTDAFHKRADFTAPMPWHSDGRLEKPSRRTSTGSQQETGSAGKSRGKTQGSRRLPTSPRTPVLSPLHPMPEEAREKCASSGSGMMTPPHSPRQPPPPDITVDNVTCGRRVFPLPILADVARLEHVQWPVLSRRASVASQGSTGGDSPLAGNAGAGGKRRASQWSNASGNSPRGGARLPQLPHKMHRGGKQLADRVNVGNKMATDSAESRENFARVLLKDCAHRAKKIATVRLSSSVSAALGHGTTDIGVENTLVAGLCDLLEKMLRHGVAANPKSALWSFLHACAQSLGRHHAQQGGERPPPALLKEIAEVEKLGFLQTDTGRGRAWVRLCLEKKCLSHRFEEALACEDVIRDMYKEYAFLRHAEYHVQLTGHLLILTTVDFHAFSSNYPPAEVQYKVVIATGRGFRAGTSANVTFRLIGDLAATSTMMRPKGASFHSNGVHEFSFVHRNLGILEAVELGHDGTGLNANWTVDHVVVANSLTEREHLFAVNQRLVKEGDSKARVRIPVTTPRVVEGDEHRGGDDPHSPAHEQPLPPQVAHEIDEISTEFASCINAVVKAFMEAKEDGAAAVRAAAQSATGTRGARAGTQDQGPGTGPRPLAEPSVSEKARLMLGENRLASPSQLEMLRSFDVVTSAGPQMHVEGHVRSPSQVGLVTKDVAVILAFRELITFCLFFSTHFDLQTQNGICQALRKVLRHGYKCRTLFGPERNVWDFIDRAHTQVRHPMPTR